MTEDSLTEAAQQAHALDFIMSRPGGFDNRLAEYGGGLSVGQGNVWISLELCSVAPSL